MELNYGLWIESSGLFLLDELSKYDFHGTLETTFITMIFLVFYGGT